MRRLFILGVLSLLVTGCDTGPSGPGELTGSVESANLSLGGAVLEVVSSGVEDFSGAGSTRVFWAPQENPAVHRVIVIGEVGGELNFTVSVQDVGGRFPRATVISLVDENNLPIPVTDAHKVRFSR